MKGYLWQSPQAQPEGTVGRLLSWEAMATDASEFCQGARTRDCRIESNLQYGNADIDPSAMAALRASGDSDRRAWKRFLWSLLEYHCRLWF